LRRLGEDTLLGVAEDHPGFSSGLNDAAAALVAVDVITPDRAREALADYAAAEAARDGHGQFLMARLRTGEPPITTIRRPSSHNGSANGRPVRFRVTATRGRHVTCRSRGARCCGARDAVTARRGSSSSAR
jgi:hypothetical protein